MAARSPYDSISVFSKSFWDLWLMKILRNVASVKYQWLIFMYVPVIYGMFTINEKTGSPWITATLGLSFLSGGFVTLATSRIISRTKLTENNHEIDTDK